MSINPKIILNRAKKGKVLSDKEIEMFFIDSSYVIFGFEYVNDILEKRSLKFEFEVEKYINRYHSMWGINQDELIFYIKKRIQGPWPKIEKHLDDAHFQRYKLFLKENNFEEYLI
jgi:hypothetical protein